MIIDVTGERNVTAGDIKADSDIEILNPEHHLATVGENERFYMELTFDHGRGYVSQERNKQKHNQELGNGVSAPIGTIYTDPQSQTGTLHLEIWEGQTKLNPAQWLRSK